MKAIIKKHNALLEVRQFINHIQPRIGQLAFNRISLIVDEAIKAKEVKK